MNTKQTEALQLALEAQMTAMVERQTEIDALAEQPAQVDPCIDGSCSCCWTHLDEQPAQPINPETRTKNGLKYSPNYVAGYNNSLKAAQQQEPVAYMGTDIEGNPNKFRLNPFGGCVPLYEKPQSVKVWDAEGYDALCQELEGWKAKASKPWVGLTNSDRLDLISAAKGIGGRIQGDGQLLALLDDHEAKLREKNA